MKQLKRGVTATDALDAELAKCGLGDIIAKSAATSAAAVGGLFAIAEETTCSTRSNCSPKPKVELVETDPRAHRKLAKAGTTMTTTKFAFVASRRPTIVATSSFTT